MKKLIKNYFLLLILFFIYSCAHQFTVTEDQYWEKIAKKSLNNQTSILEILKTERPKLFTQIMNDSKDLELVSLWGQSLNFDSGAHEKILDNNLIRDLQAQFNIHNDNHVVHAGVTHTYGYLFSILKTPYGFKRKRWIDPTLNYAFDLKDQSLSPETKDGGMLSNITYFTGKIAFKSIDDQKKLSLLKNVSAEILNFNYKSFSPVVLEEQIVQNQKMIHILRTTLVKLPKKRPLEENDFLLIYTILTPDTHREVLITAFPIKNDAYNSITSTKQLGTNQPIVLRYNAYLEGIDAAKLTGNRILFSNNLRD